MATFNLHFRPSTKNDGTGRLFIRLIHRREIRVIGIAMTINASEWDAKNHAVVIPDGCSKDRVNRLKMVQRYVKNELERLEAIAQRLDDYGVPYTVDSILKPYHAPRTGLEPTQSAGFVAYMNRLIEIMRRCGQRAKVERYVCTMNRFKKFLGNRADIPFDQFDSDLMQEYEAWMQGRGLCRNSSSYYLRVMRAVYNRAVDEEITQQCRPFRRVYTGVDKTKKRAISMTEIAKIKALDLADQPKLAFTRDLWLLSYYLCGIAFCDLAYLKKSDLCGGVLTYSRSKTKHQLTVKWLPMMQAIVNRYADPNSPYLLPIVKNPDGDPYRQKNCAMQLYNKNLKKIAKLAGIDTSLTSYTQRHSWASNAKAADIPITVISEALGHSDTAVTAIYLAELDHSRIDKANSKLLKALSAETDRQLQAASLREAKAAERAAKAAEKAAAKVAKAAAEKTAADAKAADKAAAKTHAVAAKSGGKAVRTTAKKAAATSKAAAAATKATATPVRKVVRHPIPATRLSA